MSRKEMFNVGIKKKIHQWLSKETKKEYITNPPPFFFPFFSFFFFRRNPRILMVLFPGNKRASFTSPRQLFTQDLVFRCPGIH